MAVPQNDRNPMNTEDLLKRGQYKASGLDYTGAIEEYNQALQINPSFAQAYYNRGSAHLKLGDHQRSIEDFNQALRINPNYAEAYSDRGNTYLKLGDNQGAIMDYTQALQLSPNDANTFYNRGIAYTQMGNKQKAIEDYQRAAKLFDEQGDRFNCEIAFNSLSKLATSSPLRYQQRPRCPNKTVNVGSPLNISSEFPRSRSIQTQRNRYNQFRIDWIILDLKNKLLRLWHNNRNFSLATLMIVMLLCSFMLNKIHKLRMPTVDFEETGVSITQIYSTVPNIQNCYEGVLQDAEKQKVLDKLNYIRKLHGLKSVFYNPQDDIHTAKSALVVAANNGIGNLSNPGNKCWTQEGQLENSRIASYSIIYNHHGNVNLPQQVNLYKSEEFVSAMIMDSRKNGLGSRRWLLNPLLKSISFGRVDGEPTSTKATIPGYDGEPIEVASTYMSGASIEVIDDAQIVSDMDTDFVAYPYGDYPKNLFKEDSYQRGYPTMSFSVIADRKNLHDNKNVDFSNTIVEIRGEDGQLIKVSLMGYDNDNYGLPNILQWKVENLKDGMKYTVRINNVKVMNDPKNYEYWFKLK